MNNYEKAGADHAVDLLAQNKQLKAKNKELQQGIINDRDDVVLVPKKIYDQFEKQKAENKDLRLNLLKIDAYCRANDIDLEQILEGKNEKN